MPISPGSTWVATDRDHSGQPIRVIRLTHAGRVIVETTKHASRQHHEKRYAIQLGKLLTQYRRVA